ncbi:MAG: HD domain-containing protein [Proteobacteria bacterium]|nr:MAG: HD domain-containing protein [Pseudomonadota bacterium]
MPVALVSFLDADRQWLKSCFGIPSFDMGRDEAFCAYTILSDEVLVVDNLAEDSRFANFLKVVGPPNVRFYAGAPLIARNGHRIGTLCILDFVPRTFDAEQKEILADLAAITVDALEMRLDGQELHQSAVALRDMVNQNHQQATAIENLRGGVIMTDPKQPDNPIVFANAGFYKLTGYDKSEVLGRNCRFIQGPKTEQQVVNEMRDFIAAEKPWYGVVTDYHKDGSPFINEVSITPVFDENNEIFSFVGVQNDVTERENARELLEERVMERTADLAHSKLEILQRLATAAEYRDDNTGKHNQRVARTCELIASGLGLSEVQVQLIYQAAPLHDVGKIAIPDNILLKPGKLTSEEFDTMKTHAALGAAILANGRSEGIQMAERIAKSHHERWDGKGYPMGSSGEAIPLEARILSVADVFDALTHERPYKAAWTAEDAVLEIEKQSGSQFDPQVVQAFLSLNHITLI